MQATKVVLYCIGGGIVVYYLYRIVELLTIIAQK